MKFNAPLPVPPSNTPSNLTTGMSLEHLGGELGGLLAAHDVIPVLQSVEVGPGGSPSRPSLQKGALPNLAQVLAHFVAAREGLEKSG